MRQSILPHVVSSAKPISNTLKPNPASEADAGSMAAYGASLGVHGQAKYNTPPKAGKKK